jgi:Flp pilus assembly protein TadG
MTPAELKTANPARGSVLVEFTLILPLLVLLFLGGIGFGYNIQRYNRLEESVRAGARFASMAHYDAYASKGSPPDPAIPACRTITCPDFVIPDSQPSAFRDAVKNVTVFGTDSPGTTQMPVVEGLELNNVRVTLGVSLSRPIWVEVSIVSFPMDLLIGSVTLNKPVTRFAYVGNYSFPAK